MATAHLKHEIGPTNPNAFDQFQVRLSATKEEIKKFCARMTDEDLTNSLRRGTASETTVSAFVDPKVTRLRTSMPIWLHQGFGCSDVAADYSYWMTVSHYSLPQAVSLSLGVEPHHLPEAMQSTAAKLTDPSKTNAQMFFLGRRVRMMQSHFRMGWDGYLNVYASDFHRLVNDIGMEVPDELRNMLAKRFPSIAPQSAEKTQSLTSQERNTLLQLIAAMACEQYDFDPTAARSNTVPNIRSDLNAVGLEMDDKTIRKWLKEATSLVDPEYWKR